MSSFEGSCFNITQLSITQKLHQYVSGLSQAPAADIGPHCGAVMEETGGLGSGQTALCSRMARCPSNASRDMHSLFRRFNLARKVPITMWKSTKYQAEDFTLPMLRIRDYLQYMMERYSERLLGGHAIGSDAAKLQNKAFWTHYRSVHGGHAVFAKHADRLDSVFPVVTYGDSGRTLKQTPLDLMNWQSVYGQKRKARQEHEYNKRRKLNGSDQLPPTAHNMLEIAKQQSVNVRGNSFLTRYLIFVLRKGESKKRPGLFAEILETLADELNILFHEGIEVKGQRIYVGTLRTKGDCEWQGRIGTFNRTWNHVGHNSGICSSCHGGLDGFAWEDFNDLPTWQTTLYMTRPWIRPPPFCKIPFDSTKPELFYAEDLAHYFKHGWGRNLVGSSVCLFAILGYFPGHGGNGIQRRLERAWEHWSFWRSMQTKKPSLHISAFTKENMHIKHSSSYPWLGCKMCDTMTLLKWLMFVAGLHRTSPLEESHRSILEVMHSCCYSILQFYDVLYDGNLWLERSVARELLHHGMVSLKAYQWLARKCLELRKPLFGIIPKLHYFHHACNNIKLQLDNPECVLILSPYAWTCEMDEDFVGHVSRLSRRVSIRTYALRTIQLYLIACRNADRAVV